MTQLACCVDFHIDKLLFLACIVWFCICWPHTFLPCHWYPATNPTITLWWWENEVTLWEAWFCCLWKQKPESSPCPSSTDFVFTLWESVWWLRKQADTIVTAKDNQGQYCDFYLQRNCSCGYDVGWRGCCIQQAGGEILLPASAGTVSNMLKTNMSCDIGGSIWQSFKEANLFSLKNTSSI